MNKTLITLIAGIAIGLIVAPAKGSETLKKLKDGFNDYKDNAEDEIDHAYNQGKNILKQGKNRAEEALS